MPNSPADRCFADRIRGIDPFAESSGKAIERFIASATIGLRKSVFEPLVGSYDIIRFQMINEVVADAHDALAMALGRNALFSYTHSILDSDDCYANDAMEYLSNSRVSPIERISFIELIVSTVEHRFGQLIQPVESKFSELLGAQEIRLIFRNGRFEPTDGPVVEQNVHDPFWDLVADPKWDKVRTDMRTALSLRDSGGPNPALYAARALESTVKIIGNEKGWLSGREYGAARVIDTLVSARNGRFIATWEANILKRFFSNVRNPDAHGAGSAPQPQLTPVQTNWAIEICMISVKSLLRRL